MSIKDLALAHIDTVVTTGSWREWLVLARDCRDELVRRWLLEATTPKRVGHSLELQARYARWHKFARAVQLGAINTHAIRLFIKHVRESYDVQAVLLYGSRARGDHRPGSDLNLAVIVSAAVCTESSNDMTELEIAGRVLNDLDCRCATLSPILIRHPEWTGEAPYYNPALLQDIRRDGIVLYPTEAP